MKKSNLKKSALTNFFLYSSTSSVEKLPPSENTLKIESYVVNWNAMAASHYTLQVLNNQYEMFRSLAYIS